MVFIEVHANTFKVISDALHNSGKSTRGRSMAKSVNSVESGLVTFSEKSKDRSRVKSTLPLLRESRASSLCGGGHSLIMLTELRCLW